MMIQAIGLLLISSVFMGIMSILRKEYQKRNSISVMPTVLFLFCVSIIGAGVSVAAGHGLHISGLSLSLAVWYAVISAVLDRIFYKTKLTKINILQMILAFLCCICFAAEG